ncbi:MAG: hypothetical protein GC186_18935 [Rhodobacteraceae bacterium]|nr:hypothetical protein [Paracoccaceae bacterium]
MARIHAHVHDGLAAMPLARPTLARPASATEPAWIARIEALPRWVIWQGVLIGSVAFWLVVGISVASAL